MASNQQEKVRAQKLERLHEYLKLLKESQDPSASDRAEADFLAAVDFFYATCGPRQTFEYLTNTADEILQRANKAAAEHRGAKK